MRRGLHQATILRRLLTPSALGRPDLVSPTLAFVRADDNTPLPAHCVVPRRRRRRTFSSLSSPSGTTFADNGRVGVDRGVDGGDGGGGGAAQEGPSSSARSTDSSSFPPTGRVGTVDVPASGGTSGVGKGVRGASDGRLPNWLVKWQDEFLDDRSALSESRRQIIRSGQRILGLALERVFTPHANRIVLLSVTAVLCIGGTEAVILCKELPFLESSDAGISATRYAAQQLLPLIIWETADAAVVASALDMSPEEILRQLDPTVRPEDACAALRLQLLESSRAIIAGFMLIAQLVRGFYLTASAAKAYEERIRNGDEPPLGGVKQRFFRLNGVGSCVTEVSLHRYGEHIFPVFEDPSNVAHLVRLHSRNGMVPVFWRVNPRFYGNKFTWSRLPVDADVFLKASTGKNLLYLEADATNPDDPLALGLDKVLDLTIDDASQGFRMLESLYRSRPDKLPPFRTMKVLLANSLEEAQSGGGYSYTLRHRVRYAKEVDVLIDSRAPVIMELLKWCDRVAGKNRMILVQTSSRRYFLSLQLLLKRYGYEVFDPLDWHMLRSRKEGAVEGEKSPQELHKNDENIATRALRSLLSVILDEGHISTKKDALVEAEDKGIGRHPKRMTLVEFSKMPRLVYYERTAETVNAVQALVNAGEVDVANCCALLDRDEGTKLLEESALQRKPGLIERRMKEKKKRDIEAELASVEYEEATLPENDHRNKARISRRKKYLRKELSALESKEGSESGSGHNTGLHILCSAVIFDDLFRQVRQWARMGFSAQDIQKELDMRFHDIIKDSGEVSTKVSTLESGHKGAASQEPDKHSRHVPPKDKSDSESSEGVEGAELFVGDFLDGNVPMEPPMNDADGKTKTE